MIKKIVARYKNYKKQSYLNMTKSYKTNFAFAGVGGHSISNLYPVIQYLGVPIKEVYSGKLSNAEKMASKFHGAKGTDDFQSILNNNNIDSVFICINPEKHFDFVKLSLDSGKNVFVDKPPCYTSSELEELIMSKRKGGKTCLVGLQRRYSKVYSLLKTKTKNAINYNYKFYAGSYPEGNILHDLFIHPLDTIIYLFGKVVKSEIMVTKGKSGMNINILTEHESSCKGIIELSSMHSWQKLEEHMSITTNCSVFEAIYPQFLCETMYQGDILGIPLEKIRPKKYSTKKVYFDNNYLNPITERNTLADQGFYNEILSFVNICEGRKNSNKTELHEMKDLYSFIEQINKKINL